MTNQQWNKWVKVIEYVLITAVVLFMLYVAIDFVLHMENYITTW